MKGLEYNSQRPPLKVNEYGRNLQKFVDYIVQVETKEKRTELAYAMVASVLQMNPDLRNVENGDQIVWNYLHIISDFKLFVNSPYPIPEETAHQSKPKPLTYPISRIKYRYYGKNLQKLVNNVENVNDSKYKQKYLDMLGSFMKNSGKNWNDDNITDTQIVDHLKVLSQGKISLKEDEINTDMELRQRNINPSSGFKKKGKRNNNNKFKHKRRR